MPTKRSRVQPNYKTKYRVGNWPSYDATLVQRGNLRIWMSPEAIKNWNAKPRGRRCRGGQPKYSDLAIETALTLRLLLHLPFRQTEGFLISIFELMDLRLDAPDHTTLSRRSARLKIALRPRKTTGSIELVIDSSGLAIVGEGEWAAAKHGGRGIQGWKTLHLGVDQAGVIVAQTLTDANADDATTGTRLLKKLDSKIKTVIGDSAYDTRQFYSAAIDRGAKVVVPPIRTATTDGHPWPQRDRTVRRVAKVGRRQWKKESGYHRQGRVENTFFRFKTIIGDRLRARGADAQEVEARLACDMLNRMTDLGRPESHAIEA
jgi:IS5 family transposase